ncbi:MAG: hypothetical protein KDD40_12285, partial [Bdellovibrionales bacterium]|nr:hypothetical protein [Bdellovibrionales bacterium]
DTILHEADACDNILIAKGIKREKQYKSLSSRKEDLLKKNIKELNQILKRIQTSRWIYQENYSTPDDIDKILSCIGFSL